MGFLGLSERLPRIGGSAQSELGVILLGPVPSWTVKTDVELLFDAGVADGGALATRFGIEAGRPGNGAVIVTYGVDISSSSNVMGGFVTEGAPLCPAFPSRALTVAEAGGSIPSSSISSMSEGTDDSGENGGPSKSVGSGVCLSDLCAAACSGPC